MPEGSSPEASDVPVTQVLEAIASGDPDAVRELVPRLYAELRRLAAAKLAGERPDHTLQTTELVHEAWLRLVATPHQGWRSRAYFFGAAAQAMRRILIEHARRRLQGRRGAGWQRVELEDRDLVQAPADERLLAVDEALDDLARLDPVGAEILRLHYFAGLTHAQIGELLELGERTVKRYCAFAKAWVYRWVVGRAEGSGVAGRTGPGSPLSRVDPSK